MSGLSHGSAVTEYSGLSQVPKIYQAKSAISSDLQNGFRNAKEFEYSFKKASVENLKQTSTLPFSKPTLPNQEHTDDLEKKISWFRSENARMEKLSEKIGPSRSEYLRVEENQPKLLDEPPTAMNHAMQRGISRDASIVSSGLILNDLPPLSEIRKPAYTAESGSEMPNLESLSQNYFSIPAAPKLVTPSSAAYTSTSQSSPTSAPRNFLPSQEHSVPTRPAQPNVQILQQSAPQQTTVDEEKQRLQALVDAQTKLIAEMQAQLQRERLKASLPSTKITAATSKEGIAGVSQTSLDSMFQTYLTRQKDWTALRRGLGISTSAISDTHNPRRNRETASSSFVQRTQEVQLNSVNATMQPKIQALELKRKKSIRSTSTSRLSIKSGHSQTRKAAATTCKPHRSPAKSAAPRSQRHTSTHHKPSCKGPARPPNPPVLEPQTLALLGAALHKNKLKTKVFVGRLKALVAEVLGQGQGGGRGGSRSKSKGRGLRAGGKDKSRGRQKGEGQCTLEGLAVAVSSQRSRGSEERRRRRVR